MAAAWANADNEIESVALTQAFVQGEGLLCFSAMKYVFNKIDFRILPHMYINFGR